ncbi:hypothetical protein BHE74_00018849 [Ensete ventricosum]|uniref:Uncharacterized protein n=1 Tax=Ensete ventricosum TaxID=4639 RepID=A0A445MG64_ENSVE|nr:hypothetical protein BHE74_00018849 [Ensete ventricosum]RZR73277.1 hypothetical protein BHM03_00022223 [Ensete ventricosum]
MMHPLRLPNSGIRAKATRKEEGGHGHAPCSSGRPQPCPLQWQSATARPLAMAAGCGQGPMRGPATYKESRLQRGAHRSGDLQRGTHRQRWPPTGTAPMGGPADQVAAQGGAVSPQGLPARSDVACAGAAVAQ